MELAAIPSRRLTRVGKQGQATSHSTSEGADAAALRTLERRVTELENVASSQSHELRIQFERIAQLQADCDILRIRQRTADGEPRPRAGVGRSRDAGPSVSVSGLRA